MVPLNIHYIVWIFLCKTIQPSSPYPFISFCWD